MAISQFISRLQRNTMMQAAKMRELERRLKDIERDFNPIALVVSDADDFVGGGRIFNAISVNSVDEENPDTVFQDDGTFQEKLIALGTRRNKHALIRFENPGFTKLIHGVFINIGAVVQTITTASSPAQQRFTVNLDVIGSFDPTTVTWNNQPSGSFILQSLNIGNWAASSVSRTYTLTLNNADGWAFLSLGEDIDSLRIRLDSSGDVGEVTSGVVTIDKDELSSSSSFYIGLGSGTEIVCGDDFAG